MNDALAHAVAEGRVGDRLWLYVTYHCNLACSYCLTESGRRLADRRALPPAALVAAAAEARELGFNGVGITGGEPFLHPGFPETLAEIACFLPTVVLTNGTLFRARMLDRIAPLAELPVALQLSLDSAEAARNDALRGEGNFAQVIDAVPRLLERGIRVRIASTVDPDADDDLAQLCELHRALGIPDDDHVVRPIVRRGRADAAGVGVPLGADDVLPELTLTAEGAFLHAAAPTVRDGRADLDLLVTRRVAPLHRALQAFLAVAAGMPAGDDVVRSVR